MDFPTAWRVARDTPQDEHHPDCSYATTNGAFLCDCFVLDEHPDPCECHPPAVATTFFASEEQEAVKEAAWADQMEQEMATGAELVPVAPEPYTAPVEVLADDVDSPIHPLDIPDKYDLPMHGSILACPKCGSDKTTEDGKPKGLRTDYHAKGMLHAPCGERFGWPDVQNLGEHLCRTCERCSYGWPEQVFHGEA